MPQQESACGSRGTTGLPVAKTTGRVSRSAQLWSSRYDGPAHHLDEACSVAVGGDGSRVFASGFTTTERGNGEEDATTIAFDAATGARLWVANYAGVGTAADGTDVDDRACN